MNGLKIIIFVFFWWSKIYDLLIQCIYWYSNVDKLCNSTCQCGLY